MNLTFEQANKMLAAGFQPTTGRCLIRLDPVPRMVGSLHVPDSARDRKIRDTASTGTVLAVTHKDPENFTLFNLSDSTAWVGLKEYLDGLFKIGDRVVFALYDEDRDGGEDTVVITRNEVVMAVLEP